MLGVSCEWIPFTAPYLILRVSVISVFLSLLDVFLSCVFFSQPFAFRRYLNPRSLPYPPAIAQLRLCLHPLIVGTALAFRLCFFCPSIACWFPPLVPPCLRLVCHPGLAAGSLAPRTLATLQTKCPPLFNFGPKRLSYVAPLRPRGQRMLPNPFDAMRLPHRAPPKFFHRFFVSETQCLGQRASI